MTGRRAGHLMLVVYLAASAVFFVGVALPVLRGELDFQFYADSVTYENMMEEGTKVGLVEIGFNWLGPHLILQAFGGNRTLIYLFNVAVFLVSYRLLRTSYLRVDPRKLLLGLFASPVLFTSLMSVNKEILALLVTALVAAHYATGSRVSLALGLALSPLVRWQFTVFVIAAALMRKGALRRHRGIALVGLLAACSIGYPLLLRGGTFESLDDLARAAALQEVDASGLYSVWLSFQNQYGYFVVVIPKALHLFVGLVSRVNRMGDLSDVQNNLVATSQALANLGILLVVLRQRKLRLSEGPAFLALVFGTIFGLSPIYSPRYLFPVYVLLTLLVASPAVAPSGPVGAPGQPDLPHPGSPAPGPAPMLVS